MQSPAQGASFLLGTPSPGCWCFSRLPRPDGEETGFRLALLGRPFGFSYLLPPNPALGVSKPSRERNRTEGLPLHRVHPPPSVNRRKFLLLPGLKSTCKPVTQEVSLDGRGRQVFCKIAKGSKEGLRDFSPAGLPLG